MRPEVGMAYWVDASILPSGDPEDQRVVVVVKAPEADDGTVVVVSRSGVDSFGVDDVGGGRGRGGRFSRRHAVQRRLWTSATVTPVGPLDDDVFAAVVARFTSR